MDAFDAIYTIYVLHKSILALDIMCRFLICTLHGGVHEITHHMALKSFIRMQACHVMTGRLRIEVVNV